MRDDGTQNGEPSAGRAWKPVLGLSNETDEPLSLPTRVGTIFDLPEPAELMELTVIVPARNEEDCLGACLESLVQQSDEVFALGRDWELIVVDDHSTDRTAEIASCHSGGYGHSRQQAGKGMDRQGKCDLDGGPKSARPLAAVYRRGYSA